MLAEVMEHAQWMLTLFGVLLAISPLAVLFGALAWAGRRERLRREVHARQVALTDRIHERLGAVAAPVVRRRRHGWQVRIAVPFERSAVSEALLAIVLEGFAPPDPNHGSLEIILTRQVDAPATRRVGARSLRRESPSWT